MSKLDRKEIVRDIKEKRKILDKAKAHLKRDFIGLDEVIDKIFQNLDIWFTIPQAITRPVIINLWGMTGVGKTDLVRKLVKYINFSDRFVEMQMDYDDEYGTSSVETKLMGSSIEENEPGVLLLDEIQRFRTVNEQGMELKDTKFKDMWMLLSDGKFNTSGTTKSNLLDKILENMYWDDYRMANPPKDTPSSDPDDDEFVDDEEDDEELELEVAKVINAVKTKTNNKRKEKQHKRRYHTSVWEANSIKKTLRIKEPVEIIMTWSKEKKIQMITAMLKNPDSYEGADFSKLLIFISGNLDEAYDMSHMTQDADINADTLHEFSKKINVVDIKEALKKRFKPEQIARFGNVHIIYPAFSKKNFEALIRMKIRELIKNIKKKTSIKLKIDKSVNKVIYRNGVYPAQGVRPVFSSVGAILDTNLPKFLCAAIEGGEETVSIQFEDSRLVSTIKRKKILSDIIRLDLDIIRKKNDEDSRMLISVHEAAHAIAYALLFNLAPTQITSSTLKNNGYILSHSITKTKTSIFDIIKVCFAGNVAEQLIFGEENTSASAVRDIADATTYASDYVRSYGFDKYRGVIDSEFRDDSSNKLNYMKESNEKINQILNEQYESCITLIKENMSFLKTVTMALLENGELNAEQFKVVSKKYIKNLGVKKAAEHVYYGYGAAGKKALNEIKD